MCIRDRAYCDDVYFVGYPVSFNGFLKIFSDALTGRGFTTGTLSLIHISLLISPLLLSFSTSRTVSALLFSSVPICPLAFSSPLFWWSIVWMCICLSSVHCSSLDIMRVDSPGLLMSYTISRMPSTFSFFFPGKSVYI